MARGLLMGTVSGLAFAAVVLGVASLLAPQPAGNRPPDAPSTELAPGPDSPQATDSAPDSAAPPAEPGEAAAPPAAPAATAEGGLPLADTAPAGVPEISRGDALAAPPEPGAAPETLAAADAPVVPQGPGPAPQIPGAEAAVALSTAPAARPAPLAPALDAPSEPAGDPGLDTAAESTPPAAATPDIVAEAAAGDAPAAADTGSADLPEVAAPADQPVAAAPDPGPDSGSAPPAPEAAAPDSAAPAAPLPAGADPAPSEDLPDSAPAQPPAQPLAEAGPTEPVLPGGDTGVQVNRPGDDAPAPAPEAPVADDAPARIRHAAVFTDPGGLPHLAIVLVDDGTMAAGPTILTSIPFPVTVAIDPARAGAAESMAAYRAAGIEVAALAALPAGAGPTDVNVNLQAAFATLPETVALVDPGSGGLSADPDLAAAALARLAEDGRGFVWMTGGLDRLSALAAEAGVPGIAMLRDLDGAGQDAATIRRFIDNAAFQARRDGSVVLLARLRPETVSALTLWGTANRARQVAMAPLSAVLNAM